jgi:hypothetical protein
MYSRWLFKRRPRGVVACLEWHSLLVDDACGMNESTEALPGANRVVVGYVPNRGGKMSVHQEEDPSQPIGARLIYKSGNGDAWYLTQDPATGLSAIKHVSNPQSGGHCSYLDLKAFSKAERTHRNIKRSGI